MIKFRFANGVEGSVHDGKWDSSEPQLRELCQLVGDSSELANYYHPDPDLYLATEVLKVIPGEILSNNRGAWRKDVIY